MILTLKMLSGRWLAPEPFAPPCQPSVNSILTPAASHARLSKHVMHHMRCHTFNVENNSGRMRELHETSGLPFSSYCRSLCESTRQAKDQ